MVNRTEWFWCAKCDQDKTPSDTEKGTNLIVDPSVWLLLSKDVDPTPTVSNIFTMILVTIALAMLAVYWIRIAGPIKVVPILGLCNSSIALVCSVISSKLVMGATLDWNMVLYSSFYALMSVLLLGTKYIPKLAPKINVPKMPPPWLSVKQSS